MGKQTKAGLAKTVAKGTVLGRLGIDANNQAQVKRLKVTGISNRAIATTLCMSPISVGYYLESVKLPSNLKRLSIVRTS